ncbi:MAG: reductive dehalogenase [Candidatus Thorarchaeota archaeon]
MPSSEEDSQRPHHPGPETLTERPYEMAQDFTRMSEADTIFARVQYDPDFEFYQKSEFSGAEVMISKGIPGYGRFEHELSVAAWKLYDSRHSIRRSGIGLDASGSESGRRLITDPHQLTDMVKKAARFFGAADVGIAELDRNWLYTKNRRGEEYEIPESITHAVVMLIEMDYDALSTSPAFTSSAATGLGYSTMAFVELELASFIQRLGYDAITCGNDVALSVPLAIDAGLGQYGRHGLLITKKYGPRVRIAKVLTDMPLIADSPDMDFCQSVIRFCETCEKCATNCPSQSIPYGKERTWTGPTRSNNPGIKKWYVDVESCYGFWTENGSECSNCIRSCPYNKKDGVLHRSVVWVVQHMPWMNRAVMRMDDLLGYGRQKDGSKFWKSKK